MEPVVQEKHDLDYNSHNNSYIRLVHYVKKIFQFSYLLKTIFFFK